MRIPLATYRIQFSRGFGFRKAKRTISYLAELGISDLYASPIFKARKGSPHGYDVVDPNQLNPELGTPSDFEKLTEELRGRRMGWLQDVVPNHMAFDFENQMLMDVLENGQRSDFFGFFDIEWDHPHESMKGRLLTPFLGKFYADALEDGEITLRYGPSGLTIHYHDLILPLKMESYIGFFTYQLSRLEEGLGADHPDFMTFFDVLDALKALPSLEERQDRCERIRLIKRALWELYNNNGVIHEFIDENTKYFNGEKGNPGSFDLLNGVLSEQRFRLSFWKVATEEINYRRFFNINELISLRMEDESVFTTLHSLIFKLITQERITGLRIDHIDGLYNPTVHLKRLREKASELYLLVEKILGLEEELPPFWPVQGTTGYDFMNYLNGLFCKREKEKEFNRIYSSFGGSTMPYGNLMAEKKRLIIGKHMAGDIDNLAHLLKALSSRDRYGSDITIYGIRRALVEVMAHFPVYRTYMDKDVASEADQSYITIAIERAKQSSPGLWNELRFIERFLLLSFGSDFPEEDRDQGIHFAMRFQQLTGPLMAKGFEDTTLYVYNRLLSLNEVGGNPDKFGISTFEFHDFNQKRVEFWPHSLNATSTHDTKRGEDARARINVLSEIPKEWERNLKTWSKVNRKTKKKVNGFPVPDRNDEYFLYQTLIGSFPFYEKNYPAFIRRLKEYVIKAVREAKIHTAWLKPDAGYEGAYLSFVEKILHSSDGNPFLKEFLPFQTRIAHYGVFNSLSQTVIKLTSPGVPDFYQGTELWDFSFVDPDNRCPVDFQRRRRYLGEIRKKADSDILSLIEDLLRSKEDGRIKLFLIYRGLKVRNGEAQLFREGAYIPLDTIGQSRDHVIAYARHLDCGWVVTVAPRFLSGLVKEGKYPLGQQIWQDTRILLPQGSPSRWQNAMTDQVVESRGELLVGEALAHFPVALLTNKEDK